MRRFIRWLRRAAPQERAQKISAERDLASKTRELDRKIAQGQKCADKLKETFAEQIAEGDGVSEMLRNLMHDMNHQERGK